MEQAINGFQSAGIWPYNRDVFIYKDFVAPDTYLVWLSGVQITNSNLV